MLHRQLLFVALLIGGLLIDQSGKTRVLGFERFLIIKLRRLQLLIDLVKASLCSLKVVIQVTLLMGKGGIETGSSHDSLLQHQASEQGHDAVGLFMLKAKLHQLWTSLDKSWQLAGLPQLQPAFHEISTNLMQVSWYI